MLGQQDPALGSKSLDQRSLLLISIERSETEETTFSSDKSLLDPAFGSANNKSNFKMDIVELTLQCCVNETNFNETNFNINTAINHII